MESRKWSEKKWTVFGYAAEERGRAFWIELRVLRERDSCLILKFDEVGKAGFWAEIFEVLVWRNEYGTYHLSKLYTELYFVP